MMSNVLAPDAIADLSIPENMRAAIRCMVRTMGEPLFTNFMSLEGFTGNEMFGWPDLNLFVWRGLSSVAVQSIMDLIEYGEIRLIPCKLVVYMADGREYPKEPVADTIQHYAELHWLPCKFREVKIRTWPVDANIAEQEDVYQS
jgi:hypothetical protein